MTGTHEPTDPISSWIATRLLYPLPNIVATDHLHSTPVMFTLSEAIAATAEIWGAMAKLSKMAAA